MTSVTLSRVRSSGKGQSQLRPRLRAKGYDGGDWDSGDWDSGDWDSGDVSVAAMTCVSP